MILSKKKIIFTFLSISILASVYTIISPKNYINENEIFDWVRDYITVSIGNITEKYKKKYNVQTVVNGEDYKSQQQIFVDFLSKKITQRLKKYHSRDKIIQSIRDSFEFNFNYFIFPDSLLHKTKLNYYREMLSFVANIMGNNKSVNCSSDREYKLFLENLV
mgnify:CR=1 FL=1|tara:strand:+ start:2544 stop:3029 length:486 start_codon:yes stop_codon:yes gene_type:complete